MCTAISYNNNQQHYFGRNLDLEHSFQEAITITPRNFPFNFRLSGCLNNHFAMIGIASVIDGYPLYYEATNECGLSMAALNFPGNAFYFSPQTSKLNLAPFELIPWLLGKYKTVNELRSDLSKLNIVAIAYSDTIPLSPLHWIISDKYESVVLESTASSLEIYDNPIKVLTNNPPFPFHLQNLSNYLNLTNQVPTNRFSKTLNLSLYSRGMGAIGLPGDLSSASRFVRAAFTLHNSVTNDSEEDNVNQFFHILNSVHQTKGCVQLGDQYELTLYSCCCNTTTGVYYYKTYNNSSITAVRMHNCNLNSSNLISYNLRTSPNIHFEN